MVAKPDLAVTAKPSVMFFLELNHDTLTTWYQIPHYRFAYIAESPVPYLKLGGLFSKKYTINQLLIAD